MKNISDVIKQKEREIQQKKSDIHELENDLETLRAAARLLVDDGEPVLSRPTSSQNIATAVARPANGEVKQFP